MFLPRRRRVSEARHRLVRRGLTLAGVCMLVSSGLAASLISVSDEIALGRRAQEKACTTIPRVTDRTLNVYVTGIGRRLAAQARGPAYPYSFTIANQADINAFALPGGPVWIHRGALAAAANEAQLAGVIAHEVAHIAQRHAATQISTSAVAGGLLGAMGAFLGNDAGGARAAQLGAQAMAGSYMLKFSRDDEREADRVGAEIMQRAGWDPRAMIDFMTILRRQAGHDPGSVEEFLSTHPGASERASLLRTELRGSTGGRKDTAEFRRMRARLKALYPS
jgi:predicted Zn-dependent protease